MLVAERIPAARAASEASIHIPSKPGMQKLLFILLLAIGTNALGQVTTRSAKNPLDFIPRGYVLFESIQGDLNKDGLTDYVLIIKGTDITAFVMDMAGEKVDRNRRGIIIAMRNKDHYELTSENRECFSSENEDGGVYFSPELDVRIDKGNLIVHYGHGRYGSWTYKFRYQNSDFELIGYDDMQNRGPITERSVSINLMTRKMLVRDNVNLDAEGGDEIFRETWKNLSVPKPIKLSEITDFDIFDADSLLSTVK